MTTNHIASPALVYNGAVIRDRNEMLSLTDMWKAQGADPSKRPVEWLRGEHAQRFISFMAEDLGMGEVGKSHFGLVQVSRGGPAGGGATYAHWQIGFAYAKYLSPEFHMWCNEVVRERMEGHKPGAVPATTLEQIERSFGIVRSSIHKITEMEKTVAVLPALVETVNALAAIVKPGVPGIFRPGKSAGEILAAAGFTDPPKNLAKWFGNRLERAGARVEGNGHSGLTYYRLFDPDKAEAYLKNGGAAAVEKKIAERKGQGTLALSGRAVSQILPRDLPEGMGGIVLNGELVLFDIRQANIRDGDSAVVVSAAGDVKVDACRMETGAYKPMGARSATTSPQMEARLGRRDPVSTAWGCVVLGRVIDRRPARVGPVLAVDNMSALPA